MAENTGQNELLGPDDRHLPAVQMNLFPVKEVEADGIEMGILNDGTPYLTMRGLSRICGVHNKVINQLGNNWQEERTKPRGKKIAEMLSAQGHSGESLYVLTKSGGKEVHAYSDAACMAILEYYAFEAHENNVALQHYRLLARSSLRIFIYNRCGYDPQKVIPQSWKNFQERILLNNQIPPGYFSVFREIADLVVNMIQRGCPIDSHTVPDVSVGIVWSKHWDTTGMDAKFGKRMKFDHVYPDSFPQSQANPVAAWIYPVDALGVFRIWIQENYIPTNFPKYVSGKVKKGVFPPSQAQLLIESLTRGDAPKLDSK